MRSSSPRPIRLGVVLRSSTRTASCSASARCLLQVAQGARASDVNMIVPIDLLPPILSDLLRQGTRGQATTPPGSAPLRPESNGSVVVMSVAEGGPAAEGGASSGRRHLGCPGQRGRGSRRLLSEAMGDGAGGIGSSTPDRARQVVEAWLRVKSSDRGRFLRRPTIQ